MTAAKDPVRRPRDKVGFLSFTSVMVSLQDVALRVLTLTFWCLSCHRGRVDEWASWRFHRVGMTFSTVAGDNQGKGSSLQASSRRRPTSRIRLAQGVSNST